MQPSTNGHVVPPTPPVPDPGNKNLLKDRAYLEIKRLIHQETFPPGTFLSERQLSERLGMSKTPIRSALEHLEAQGLVAVSPQQGIVVRGLTARELIDLFDVRFAMEPFVVRRLAGRLSTPQVALLRQNLDAHRLKMQKKDVEGMTDLDVAFHLLLCEFADNREFLNVLRAVLDKLYREIRRSTWQDVGRIEATVQEHEEVARALIEGLGEHAAERMEFHLTYGKRLLYSRDELHRTR